MQLSAVADPLAGTWDVAIDGRWLGDGPGERQTVEFPSFDPADVGSARLLGLWLDNGDSYTLSALRPGNAKGQDKDEISVGLPDSRAEMQVYDPRLSTEYDASGTPRRFGIELWLGSDPDGDQSPLRLAGEARDDGSDRSDGALSVYPMRAHGADGEGIGLYLLVRS